MYDISIVEKTACVYDSKTKEYLGRVWYDKNGRWGFVSVCQGERLLPIGLCLTRLRNNQCNHSESNGTLEWQHNIDRKDHYICQVCYEWVTFDELPF